MGRTMGREMGRQGRLKHKLIVKQTALLLTLLTFLWLPLFAIAVQIDPIDSEYHNNGYCQKIGRNYSPFIKEVCFRYDTKVRFATLMGEPVDYALMRWYWQDPQAPTIRFRDTEQLKGINIQRDIFANADFKQWLNRLSINARFYLKGFGFSSHRVDRQALEVNTAWYFYSDPGVVHGAGADWSFNTPGSANWDKLLFRSGSQCQQLEQNRQEGQYLSETVAKEVVDNYSDIAVPILCNVKVYGISDLNHEIRKIIKAKCEESNSCKDKKTTPANEEDREAEGKEKEKEKQNKVKDWFSEDDSTKQNEEKIEDLSKDTIVKDNTQNGVTDWFEVDRIEKKQAQEREARRLEKLAAEKAEQERLRKIQEQEYALALENLKTKFNGIIEYSTPDKTKHLIQKKLEGKNGTPVYSTFVITNTDGTISEEIDYTLYLERSDGIYLADGSLVYETGYPRCGQTVYTGISNFSVYSLEDLSLIRTGTKEYRYWPFAICFTSS